MKRSLTNEQVEEARRLYSTKVASQKDLANKYGCSVVTISLWVDPNEERRIKKFSDRRKKAVEEFDRHVLTVIRLLKDLGSNSMEVHRLTHLPLEITNKYYAQCPVDHREIYSLCD